MIKTISLVLLFSVMFNCVALAGTVNISEMVWWRDGAEGVFDILLDAGPVGISGMEDSIRDRVVPDLTIQVGTRLTVELPSDGLRELANVAFTVVEIPCDAIFVIINGTSFWFDVPPVIMDGRTMLPLRAIDADIIWDEETRRIEISV
ncbi:MAG: copper amine oxidase N-terminal domain-containing protein [Defluviitaleaceae bacterium]|nr:copper amine oxidase N-terminal domain-containing protein [Defluviitaleaceae bacterium]MCL2263125.1 copper amine oxidase N-terminal domain-containing protein [Defluviitaleaceae bacterium]